MIKASDNRIKGPSADDFMGMCPHAHGRELLAESLVYLRSDRRGRPCIKYGALRDKFTAPAAAALADVFCFERVDRQLLLAGKGGAATGFAVPNGKRNTKVPLTRDAPVPFQIFNPCDVTAFHLRRIPVDAIGSLKKTIPFG